MALYTLKEFGEKCGLKPNALSNEKKRGKIVVDDQKRVDTTNPVNAVYLQKRLAKLGSDEVVHTPVAGSQGIAPEIPQERAPVSELFTLEKEKKAVDLERARQDLELAELKKHKMRGDLIPTGIVKTAIAQLFGGFSASFRQASENLITEFTQIAHLNRNQQAELRKKLVKIVNNAIDQGIEEGKRVVDNAVSDIKGE
jgi:hypothetical protein